MANIRPDRNEVLVPAYTSFSVPSSVVKAGLKVSLYDLDPGTLSPDLKSLKKALSPATLAVVVCHLYGYPCEMDGIISAVRNSGAYLIDDAAQAMGATYRGKAIGTFGDAGLFSLSRGKNITTVDGGIVITDSDTLATAMTKVKLENTGRLQTLVLLMKALLYNILLRPTFYWLPQKLPFLKIGQSLFSPDFPMQKYTASQAAIGRRMLQKLDGINHKRRAIAQRFKAGFQANGPEKLFSWLEDNEPVFLRFPVIGGNKQPGTEKGLGIVRSYPTSLDKIEGLKPHLVSTGEFPGAMALANRILTLPTHRYVTPEDVEKIVLWVNANYVDGEGN
jgi:dTDP-4-amino-4,6-dideoxygalactose transaminase